MTCVDICVQRDVNVIHDDVTKTFGRNVKYVAFKSIPVQVEFFFSSCVTDTYHFNSRKKTFKKNFHLNCSCKQLLDILN